MHAFWSWQHVVSTPLNFVMRIGPCLVPLIVCAMVCSAHAGEAPIDRAVTALVSQLVDGDAAEYRGGRRIHPMPGKEGVELAFFTIEGFGGGNNYTFYLAAFESAGGNAASGRYQLLGMEQIGGNAWRFVDIERFRTDAECITLDTKNYAPGDPMSHPTIAGTASYCLQLYPGRSTGTLEPAADGSAVRESRRQR
jgi:hypothetical protein